MVDQVQGVQPFLTIGVPTYNRHDLLRETLDSILAQGFTDFEVIVGNDYTAEVLSGEMLGISDPRIRFVNHTRNLREVGNMNALLALASGRYFTWLFDDDLYEPDFLQSAHDCLAATGFPPAFFSSFRMMQEEEQFQPGTVPRTAIHVLTGREFLGRYTANRPEIASTCGLFDTAALRRTVGGVEELCASAIGVYCEYLLLVRVALFDRIAYMNAPFYVFRIHADSWSESPAELEKYIEAGRELVRRCGEVLQHPDLIADFNSNLMMICEQHLITFAHRSAKIEVARRKFGVFALYRALARHRKEALSTRNTFVDQGGDDGLRTRLAFMKMNSNCYRTIVLSMASYFYRSIRRSRES